MFVMFDADTMIYPKETAWFHELQADGSILDVKQTQLYQEDHIGLRTLDEAGKVQFLTFEGAHLHITNDQIDNIIVPFLKA
jgi:palmitoyl-protein thioesterase